MVRECSLNTRVVGGIAGIGMIPTDREKESERRKMRGGGPFPSYARTVKEPLDGTPVVSVNVVCVSAVGDVPHWMLTLQLNVDPRSALGKVMLSSWLTRFFPGPRVMTPELRVKPPDDPSVPVILTLTYIVTVLDPPGPLLTPNFHVCTPPVFDRESLWVHWNCVRSGGAHVGHVAAA